MSSRHGRGPGIATVIGIALVAASGVGSAQERAATTRPAAKPRPAPRRIMVSASPMEALNPPIIDENTSILFTGESWSDWSQRDGQPSRWHLVPQTWSILVGQEDGHEDAVSNDVAGDFRLHIEFMCPEMPEKAGQARANSGVYLHGRYEVQVLDTHGQEPFPGGCGAIYGIAPPLVNASFAAGEWQTYDIMFRAPRFDEQGVMTKPAYVTVLQNGIMIHNNQELPRVTPGGLGDTMVARGPLLLQDHGDPVQYRNIWWRKLNQGQMRLLIVTAADVEADAIGAPAGTALVVGGIGRTNAAAATTEILVRDGPFDAVVSAGIAGSLPGSELERGAVLVASACVYAEEGLVTPAGFADIEATGFRLGDFLGNRVPVDPALLELLGAVFPTGAIATVATCSGTDAAARAIATRTGAVAEAMEGAAVVHAARRLGIPGIEIRSVSNDTGDRDAQTWDLPLALSAIRVGVTRAVDLIRSSGLYDA